MPCHADTKITAGIAHWESVSHDGPATPTLASTWLSTPLGAKNCVQTSPMATMLVTYGVKYAVRNTAFIARLLPLQSTANPRAATIVRGMTPRVKTVVFLSVVQKNGSSVSRR